MSYIRGGEPGWERIGLFDSAERRALWRRVIGEDEFGEPDAIELCSGREGDDAFVRIDRSNPQWADIADVLLRASCEEALR